VDEAKWIAQYIMAFKKISVRTVSMISVVALGTALVFAGIFYWGYSQIPTDKEIRGCMTTKMYKVHLCPGSNTYVPLSQTSSYLQKSVVLTEDSSFWDHQGFDLQEMQNSLKANLAKGKYARGGSTISQQLAKNLFLSKDKTLIRKFLEAIITVRIEKTLSKKQILERYLNVVQFGKDIYGVKAASEFYFHKSPNDLDLVESTFLTFLLPSPEVYSKSFYKKKLTPFAEKRLHTIMDRLYQYNRITESEYLTGKAELETFLGGSDLRVIDPTLDQITEDDPEVEEQLDDY
jgi:monofunctional biosynthetic peptidoglycan transglycosylase